MRTKLTDNDIKKALEALPGWSLENGAIVKSYKFGKFADGIAFVPRVAVAADAMDHHPDIDIRYTTIRVALSTHDADGVTALDTKLAGEIEKLKR